MAGLSAAEAETYRRDGYLIPDYRLPEEKLATLQRALDKLIADNPGVRPEQLISIHVDGRNAEGTVGSKVFLDLAQDPDILDLVEGVLGPDIILWGCAMFCKPPGDGMAVPMHQDGHYWPIRPLANCTVWIAIEDSDVGNGCLQVVPGSHKAQIQYEHLKETGHVALSDRIREDAYDPADLVNVELKAGSLSMHDVYMIHGSNPNTSDRRRSGVAIRYMPATSHFDRAFRTPNSSEMVVDFSTRPLWLVRGEDRTGRNDFAVGH